MITKGSLPFAADNDQVRAEHERDSHYRRESALLQAATASTLVRGVQALRLAQLNLSHQHYLTRLWFLRSGFSLNGPNLFVGIGRVKLSTEAIEIATAFLCYELRWFEVDNLVDGARTLRFADLPWPHEGALVSRVLGGAHSPMQVSDFPTEPNNFLRFLLHPHAPNFTELLRTSWASSRDEFGTLCSFSTVFWGRYMKPTSTSYWPHILCYTHSLMGARNIRSKVFARSS